MKTSDVETNGWTRLALSPPNGNAEWRARLPLRYAPRLVGFIHDERGPAKPDGSDFTYLEDTVKANRDTLCSIGWPLPSGLQSSLLTEFVLTARAWVDEPLKIVSAAQVFTNSSRVAFKTVTTSVSLTNGHLARVPVSTSILPGSTSGPSGTISTACPTAR